MKLCASMIVKNEAAIIGRCLESIRDADEIVVLDTGSTDGTAAAIAGLGMPNVRHVVGEYVWEDHFANARNASLSKCTGDWALVIDADDWMEPGAIPKIRAAAAATDAKALNTLMVHDGHQQSYYLYPKVLRLGVGVRFNGADHEAPNVQGAGGPVATMFLGKSEQHAADPDRTLRIMSWEHIRNPEDARTMNYLAREYWYRRDYATAIPLFQKYVGCSRFPAERADAYLYLARMFWATAQGDKARESCMMALTINANFSEALRFMAEISFEHNAVRWREFAKLASDERVLFVRR